LWCCVPLRCRGVSLPTNLACGAKGTQAVSAGELAVGRARRERLVGGEPTAQRRCLRAGKARKRHTVGVLLAVSIMARKNWYLMKC
jgi:hypothetical protein